MKRITILVITIFTGFFANAQNLTEYNDFFIKKIPEYRSWLNQSNMGAILRVDTIEVSDEELLLKLQCFDTLRNSLADKANLDSLDVNLRHINQTYSEVLFDKLVFLMDLEKTEAKIKIDCNEALVYVKYSNGKILTKPMTKMGEVADGHKIKINSIKGINKKGSTSVNETIDIVKNKLITELEKEYEKYEPMFEDFDFEVVSRLGNELVIEINNVVELVISDDSYFEHISVKFQFTEDEDELKVDYVIRAKYGSGIIWAPKSSDYYDMTPKYQSDLEKFSIKLKNQIDNILKTK